MNTNQFQNFYFVIARSLRRGNLHRVDSHAHFRSLGMTEARGFIVLAILTILTIFLSSPPHIFAAVKKSGDIELITDEPLFPSTIAWYPGLRMEKSIQVKNRGTGTKKVEIEAMSELVSKNLADVLEFEVKEGTKTLYGGTPVKTLKNFLDLGTLELSEVRVNDDGKSYALIVSMPDTAGNEYQGGKVSFDLRVGFPGDAASSVIISSDTVTSTAVSTTPVTLPSFAKSVRSIPLVLGESISPTPSTSSGLRPIISPAGVITGENPLKIILWLLAAGVIILALILRKFFPRRQN